MRWDSCASSLKTSTRTRLTRLSTDCFATCLETFCAIKTCGRPLFSFIPLPTAVFLGHSDSASVRANEVLDDLTIPGYGQSTSNSIQLGVVMLNSRKHPTPERNHVAQHQFPAPGQFERLLDSDEAAALLGIHKKTLQRMARTGELPGFQIGDLWRFRASTLNEWLASKLAS